LATTPQSGGSEMMLLENTDPLSTPPTGLTSQAEGEESLGPDDGK